LPIRRNCQDHWLTQLPQLEKNIRNFSRPSRRNSLAINEGVGQTAM
jgi:hypothetical protein